MVGAEKHSFLIMIVKLRIVLRNVRKKRKNLEAEGTKKKEYKIEIEETIFLKHKVIVEVLE